MTLSHQLDWALGLLVLVATPVSATDCTGVVAPTGGTLGDCPAEGTLAHGHTCTATCAGASAGLPMRCADGMLRSAAQCCTAGTLWDGTDGGECMACPHSSSDHDSNPASPCVDCAPGTFSNVLGGTECAHCASGTYSSVASATCTACEDGKADSDSDPATPCVDFGDSVPNCPDGSYMASVSCFDSITVEIHVESWGSEITWDIDSQHATVYADDDEGRDFVYEINGLSYRVEHSLNYADSYGDGWDGGFWRLVSPCGDLLAQVSPEGAGGAFVFDGMSLCCEAGNPAALFDAQTCFQCPEGQFSQGGSPCESCPPGKYGAIGASTSSDCEPCAAGFSDDDEDPSTPCIPCAAGTYSSAIAAVGRCTSSCPTGTYAAPGATTGSNCEECRPGRYDESVCDLQPGTLMGVNPGFHTYYPTGSRRVFTEPDWLAGWYLEMQCPGERACVQSIGLASNAHECALAVMDDYPSANSVVFRDRGKQCYAGFDIPEIVDGFTGYPVDHSSGGGPDTSMACMLYRDPGTPCVACPAGKFSITTSMCEHCPSPGSYADPGSDSIDDCLACPPGRADSDGDPATPCTICMPGTFSGATGLVGACSFCPSGSISSGGALSIEACKPTVEGSWAACEPCASERESTVSDDPTGSSIAPEMPFCLDTVTVKIQIATWGEEIVWHIDDHMERYTNGNNGEYLVHELAVPYDEDLHTFTFVDTFGDGWHGGWWQLLNSCGGTVGGGPVDGQVLGSGGAFTFSGSSLCCACNDDPDGILSSRGTSCTFWLATINSDCDAITDSLGRGDMRAREVCPVSCGDCSAEALNTTQRVCGQCPTGYSYDSDTNLFLDFDECSINQGGCDPLMGFYSPEGMWIVEPCTNVQASFSCNSCPDGFELVNNVCRLPLLPSADVNATSRPEFRDTATVIPIVMISVVASVATAESEKHLIAAVRNFIATALEADASDFAVEKFSGEQSVEGEMQLGISFVKENAKSLLLSLIEQLADPTSLLLTSGSATPVVLDASPTIDFVCPTGKVRLNGESMCRKCASPAYADPETNACLKCPQFQIPTDIGDACECQEGYYNTEVVRPACYLNDFIKSDPNQGANVACTPCAEMECLDTCQGNQVTIKEGWMPFSQTADSATLPTFRCKHLESCPGGVIQASETIACSVGYGEPLCGTCEPDHVLARNGECRPCGKMNKTGLVAAVLFIFFLMFALANISVWFNAFSAFATVWGFVGSLQLKPVGKCLVATLQILGGLAANLKVIFPLTFQVFIDGFVEYFRFDIVGILFHLVRCLLRPLTYARWRNSKKCNTNRLYAQEFGCVTDGTYSSSVVVTFVALLVVVTCVGVYHLFRIWTDEHKKVGEDEQRETALELYQLFDIDGDGIGKDEVAMIAMRIAPGATQKDIDSLFMMADADGSGHIDFEEFYGAAYSQSSEHGQDTVDSDAMDDPQSTIDLASLVKRKRTADRRTQTLTVLFVVVFLLYPGITNKIFDGLICRDLSSISVLEVDYNVDCAATYMQRQLFNGSLVLLWPIGLPFILWFYLFRRRTEVLAEDPETLEELDFILGDYHPKFWYWELVEMARKLMLTGLIGLFERGSIVQSVRNPDQQFVATVLSFVFFALTVRAMPYKNPVFNAVKIFTEFQIFGILLVCVVLQTSRYGLPEYGYGTAGDYGTFQLVLMLCVIPVIAYALFKNVQSAAAIRLQATARHAQQEVANPTFDAEGAEGPDIFEDESLPTKTGPTLG